MSMMRRDLNQTKTLQKALTQSRLVNEIHFLLWRAPFQNADKWDAGWMCREHALVTASLGALLGFKPFLAWGKVALIGDADDSLNKRAMMITEPHSWAMFENVGVCDLSLNLAEADRMRWRPWPISVLALGHPQVRLEMYGHEESEKWEQAAKAALQTSGCHILYLGGSIESLSTRYLKGALEYINSPLSDELRVFGDVEIYSKAILHLWGVYNRRRNCMSIGGISHTEAWKKLTSMEGGATEWLAREAHLPMD